MEIQQKLKHYVYQVTNLINGMIYVGKHSTEDIQSDNYFGSGVQIVKAIQQFGRQNFKREILFQFDTKQQAYDKQAEIVDQDFINRPDTYNIIKGGLTSDTKGMGVFKDKYGNLILLRLDDQRVINGWVVGKNDGYKMIRKKDLSQCKYIKPNQSFDQQIWQYGSIYNVVMVKDIITGQNLRIEKDDPRLKTGQFVGVRKNIFTAIDKDGNSYQITKDDPRYINGELVAESKGRMTIRKKDLSQQKVIKKGQWFDQNQWQRGTVTQIGMISARNIITGQYLQVKKDDPRWKTGQLVGALKGKKFYHNKQLNKQGLFFEGQQPENWQSGRLPQPKGVVIWIFNKQTGEEKQHKLGNLIPEGFVKGRSKRKIRDLIYE